MNTQTFPSLIGSLPPLQPDEEDVSYDIESLFTNVPVKKTIKYISKTVYEDEKLPSFCSRLVFSKLLLKATTENLFTANGKLYKQIDGVSMGGPLSVVFAGCFLNYMEEKVVAPRNPVFYASYVDDTYVRKKKNEKDDLYNALNSFHNNIRLTIENNPTKFLDTHILRNINDTFAFKVVRKDTKLTTHWSSAIPKLYKRNMIKGDLFRAFRIGSDFKHELELIKEKYIRAGFPVKFILAIIKQFETKKEDFPVPEGLQDGKKKIHFKLLFFPNKRILHFQIH